MSKFCDDIRKIHGKRHHKIKQSMRIYDIYRDAKTKGYLPDDITIDLFRRIMKQLNLKLAQFIADGNVYTLPYRMGEIYLIKKDTKLKMRNGQIITKLRPDWNRTIKLWEEDQESYEQKKIVYKYYDKVYFPIYSKRKAIYTNKMFMSIKMGRHIMGLVHENCKNNNIEAFKNRLPC